MPLSTRRALWLATLAGLIPSVILGYGLFWPRAGWVDPFNYYAGRDFINFWFGAHLAVSGRAGVIYDLGAYEAAMRAAFPPATQFMNFSYPPHTLALLAPIGLLPYAAAWACWTVGGLAAFAFGAVGVGNLRGLRDRPSLEIAALALLCPAVLLVASIGQATLLLAALIVGGLRILPARPILAGILFGLATVKPQLGMLIPLVVLLRGAWRALAAAAATAAVMVAASVALFGSQPWADYLANTVPYQQRVLLEPYGFVWTLMASPFAWATKIGIDVPVALKLHGGLAFVIAGLALLYVRVCADWRLVTALLALAGVIVSPYALTYDLAIPAAALLAYLLARREPLGRPQLILIALFWATPYAAMWLDRLGLPLIAPVSLALLGALAREAGSFVLRAPQAAPQPGRSARTQ